MNNLGCIFLEQGIDFEFDKVCDCCILHHDNRGLPVLLNNYHGEMIDWEYIFNVKAQRVAKQKEKTIFECENCYHLGEYFFSGERKISEFHFSHCRLCNAKCIYCSDEYSCSVQNYNTYPIIKDLIEKGYYKSGGEATFQGGEPTCMQNFDELIQLFTQYGTNVRVHSSAIKYSETVYNALEQNKGTIVISLDSGSKDTYFKIKQTDKFDIVCSNIKKYAQASKDNVIIKYIIIPGINDNIYEIDKFFRLIKSFGITTVALDLEIQYARKYNNKDVSNHIFLLVDYFNQKAQDLKIKVLIYSFLSYVLKNRNMKKLPKYIGKNNFLCSLYMIRYVDKRKNIEYKR